MNNRRKLRIKRAYLLRVGVLVGVIALCAALVVFACNKDNLKAQEAEGESVTVSMPIIEAPKVTEAVTVELPEFEDIEVTTHEDDYNYPEVVWGYGDPDNDIYPFNTMSKDWGSEVYEEGYRYFQIPDEYKRSGGCFPEVVQVYLWSLCQQKGIDYYMVVAMIEHESGYRWDCTGDHGNSKGYMQIYEKWHRERMAEEGCVDLYEPYGNLRVGLNFLEEIWSQYYESSGANCCLMVYNMGAQTARSNWAQGVYSTSYSRGILARAEEIK